MGYSRAWYALNRERILAARRQRYDTVKEQANRARRSHYARHNESILKRQRQDRAQCPCCKLSFRRLYLPQHIRRRHPTP